MTSFESGLYTEQRLKNIMVFFLIREYAFEKLLRDYVAFFFSKGDNLFVKHDGIFFGLFIDAEHLLGRFTDFDRSRFRRRPSPEIVEPLGDALSMFHLSDCRLFEYP